MKRVSLLAAAVVPGVLWAQTTVYKCSADMYSEKPCSTRIVRSYDSPVDTRASRTVEMVAHRLPGETDQELALRKRRIHLSVSDRDECARLDKKIPFEQERLRNSPNQDEIDQAQDSLFEAKKRFGQLHC
jgi:hypothetical protein